MQTPTTQTYQDAFAKIKKLNTDIAGLIVEKEKNTELANVAREDLENVLKRKKEAEDSIELLSSEMIKAADLSEQAYGDASKIVQESRDVISASINTIGSILTIIDQLIEAGDKQSQANEEEHTKIVKKYEDLAIYKRDLDIYKERITKVVQDNNLDIKIIL